MVLELIRQGLFVEYEVSERKYLHIKGFLKHQKIDNPSKTFLIPAYEQSAEIQESSPDNTEASIGLASHTRALPESSRLMGGDGIGVDGIRKTAHAPRETESEIFGHMAAIKSRYPKAAREDWITAEKTARALVTDSGVSWDALQAGVERYRKHCDATGRIVMNPAKFFGDVDRPWFQGWPIPPKRGEKPAPNHDAAWAEAKSRAAAIGFRAPYEHETPSAYMTDIKHAENAPRSGPHSIAALTEKMRMPA
jgi:hypothetical protein